MKKFGEMITLVFFTMVYLFIAYLCFYLDTFSKKDEATFGILVTMIFVGVAILVTFKREWQKIRKVN